MKVQYLGHSCFLLTTSKAKILIDPFLTGNPRAVTTADKVSADFILVSHAHGDHYGDAVSIARRTGATIVAPYELALHAGAQGAKVHPMGCGGGKDFSFGRVQLTIAHHSSSVEEGGKAVSVAAPAGFLIRAEGKTVYFAGDTALTMEMELLGRRNVIDLALLPIGDNFTMGPSDAAEAARMLRTRRAVPMHYNTFDLIEVDPGIFKKEAEKHGCRVDVLQPGESLEL
ncbi:MAG: metal-dependent hydrolase [Verrucomicrobia bacterium]|nr:metal-dependent hydrolase [Verrucomicrobiota bacterium]NBR63660.1 metal-dependent hydrolase [Verrucomicrobiota bacterium]